MESEKNLLENDNLVIDEIASDSLRETAKWAKFISIAGFIFSALIILFAFYYYNQVTKYKFIRTDNSRYLMIALFYVAIAIVWIITAVFQLRFASKLTSALEVNGQNELQESFSNLKIYYRISGIVAILSLLLSLLGMLGIMSDGGL